MEEGARGKGGKRIIRILICYTARSNIEKKTHTCWHDGDHISDCTANECLLFGFFILAHTHIHTKCVFPYSMLATNTHKHSLYRAREHKYIHMASTYTITSKHTEWICRADDHRMSNETLRIHAHNRIAIQWHTCTQTKFRFR